MRHPIRTNRFKKDVALMLKRGKDGSKLAEIIRKLVAEEALDAKHYDHQLIGVFSGRRECHIEPDWLLIYKLDENDIIFERTGKHSDLFK